MMLTHHRPVQQAPRELLCAFALVKQKLIKL